MALPQLSSVKDLSFTRDDAFQSVKGAARGNLGIPLLLLTMLGMMTLPMPAFLLDIFFSFNIALAIVVLLVAVYSLRPLDFAVFPTVLLVSTLLRLALNVASTRVVLLEGHKGGDAAGKVIEAFGAVVIGGNYAVGLVVFAILMIINFVVVTKGAGRISEVSARFTLDAMPGKQMAIDADLNAGLIDADQAKIRREEVSSEADFYGSMDGASKFVRGDAIAGILILVINIIGGLAIGMVQHDLEFADAMEKYSLLTIGDGLVAQIPSLLLSTAAAIIVTRVNSAKDMGEQIAEQMFDSPKALAVTSLILTVMGSIPGMPHFSFLAIATACGFGAIFINHHNKQDNTDIKSEKKEVEEQEKLEADKPLELGWDDVAPVDMIGLEVGYRLIPMVDKSQGGELLGRIKGIRKKLSQEIGFLIPSVHIRDNLDLLPSVYRISLMGVTLAESDIHPEKFLAINPGQVFGPIDGIAGKDPAFGLDAIWIDESKKEQAQTLGYTVVDASTVVATHLNQLIQKHSHELLGHEDVQKLIDLLAKTSPKLAEMLVPDTVSINMLQRILMALLEEDIPVRDMRTIAEAIGSAASRTQDFSELLSAVRVSLSRSIIQSIVGPEDELPVITLDPALEQLLLKSLQQSQQIGTDDTLVLEPAVAEKLQSALLEAAQKQEMLGKEIVLIVAAPIRLTMSKFIRYGIPEMSVLSYNEIPENRQITIDASINV